jgi:hypothetical protein
LLTLMVYVVDLLMIGARQKGQKRLYHGADTFM